jgi:hypothetical protein
MGYLSPLCNTVATADVSMTIATNNFEIKKIEPFSLF